MMDRAATLLARQGEGEPQPYCVLSLDGHDEGEIFRSGEGAYQQWMHNVTLETGRSAREHYMPLYRAPVPSEPSPEGCCLRCLEGVSDRLYYLCDECAVAVQKREPSEEDMDRFDDLLGDYAAALADYYTPFCTMNSAGVQAARNKLTAHVRTLAGRKGEG